MSEQPDLSIIIVNLNAPEMLRRCLESIRDTQHDLLVEVILVDNHSTDESLSVAREVMPELIILAQEKNRGYVPANNIGLAVATGNAVMFLNNDTLITEGCFSELLRFLDTHPTAGAIGGRLLNPDGSDQGAARSFPTLMNGLFGRRSILTRWFPNNRWSQRYLSSRRHTGDEPFAVEHLSSACLVLRTRLAKALNGMDEGFHLYWVDAELCSRVLEKGYGVFCVPRAKIYHFEGQGGSSRTWLQRCRSIRVFHQDAYRAYVKIYRLPVFHPGRLLAASALALRAVALMAMQMVQPARSLSSGGRN